MPRSRPTWPALVALLLLATACGTPAVPEKTAVQPAPAATGTPAPTATLRATDTAQPTEAARATETATQPPTTTPAPTATEAASTDDGPTAEQAQLLAGLESRGPAPELHNEVWLNSDPLKLADLRGKVVMVEFWTYG